LLATWNERETALIATNPTRVPGLANPPFGPTAHMGRLKGDAKAKAATEEAAQRELYTQLVGSLLVRRFKSYDRCTIEIHIEQNAQVSQTAIGAQIAELYLELEQHNERRPILSPQTFFQSKMQEAAFSLPDALLWIFGRAFGSKGLPTEIHYLYFERLRDKYRHIVDVDNGKMFSRRHPIEMRCPARDKRSNAAAV